MGWLEIRNTGVSTLDVLEAMAQGMGIERILIRFPTLLASDIADSAAVARFVIIRYGGPGNELRTGSRVDQFERECRKTGRWSEDEETELMGLMSSGASPENAARILMRMKKDVADKLNALKNR